MDILLLTSTHDRLQFQWNQKHLSSAIQLCDQLYHGMVTVCLIRIRVQIFLLKWIVVKSCQGYFTDAVQNRLVVLQKIVNF